MSEIIMAKIKMFKIIIVKPTMVKLTNSFKLIMGLLLWLN
jgi:hypothetical protein